jgi:hypothetical protein
MSLDDAPGGWRVWADDPDGRSVLAYRPDVFDGTAYPAACLPTIYVSNGTRRRRPGARRRDRDTWYVTLFLEPEVEGPSETYDSREAAVEGALALARRFDDGDVSYRDRYQVPREAYFARLDELTGRRE